MGRTWEEFSSFPAKKLQKSGKYFIFAGQKNCKNLKAV